MKINWGYKILIFYGFFVLGMLFIVVKSTNQNFDLVQKDYYADELRYQQVIDATQNAKNIGGELQTVVNDGKLIIFFPENFKQSTVKGTAHLYYAADEKKDLTKDFSVSNGMVAMELLSKTKGAYTLKLNMESKGAQFYYEQKIFF